MKEKITAIIILIVVLSSVLILFSWLNQTPIEVNEEQTEGESTEEILDEIDGSLLGEDDEIEIGEMV